MALFAWMNAMIFQEYIQDFKEQMRKQNSKVLLLIDNASSHCKLNLSHITIKFYPSNCTSRLQPLDQGIIKAFKGYYKHLLVNKLVNNMIIIYNYIFYFIFHFYYHF